MEDWMDTRATFGNNPYMRTPRQPKNPVRGGGRRGRGGGRGRRVRIAAAMRCRKNLFVYDEGLRSSEVQNAVDSIGGPGGEEEEGRGRVMGANNIRMSQAGLYVQSGHFYHPGSDPGYGSGSGSARNRCGSETLPIEVNPDQKFPVFFASS